MKPAISFLLPYRLFREDKEFLEANIERQTKNVVGSENLSDLRFVANYQVELNVIYNKPVELKITTTQITRSLKSVMPASKCLGLVQTYTPTKSKTSLPVINFKIFF